MIEKPRKKKLTNVQKKTKLKRDLFFGLNWRNQKKEMIKKIIEPKN
jgi:hypothetical protein